MLQSKYLDGVEILSVNVDSLRSSLREIASKIKSKYPHVLKIILFGSFGKDNFTPYSDVDIAIILKETDKHFLKRQDEFIDYFVNIPFDVNLIVYKQEEFNKMLREGNNFIREIMKGIRL